MSPTSTPTVTPATTGWSVLQAKDMHFTIQYPPNLAVSKNPGNYTIYDNHPKPEEYGFDVSIARTGKEEADGFLSAPLGRIATGDMPIYNTHIVTKLADFTVNGYRVVHIIDFYPGSTQDGPLDLDRYIVMKDSTFYYDLTSGYLSAKMDQKKRDEFSNLLKKIVSTFTIN